MTDPRFILPNDRVQHVCNLVDRIFKMGRGFKVHPPKEVLDDPAVLKSDQIVERLADTKWWLKLVDGSEEVLTLPELIFLVVNVNAVRQQIEAGKPGTTELKIPADQLMAPEAVKAFLGTLTLEGLA